MNHLYDLIASISLLAVLFHPTITASPVKPESPELVTAYLELLKQYPIENAGLGIDELSNGLVHDQPMTYGLVVSAEVYRYRQLPTVEGEQYIRNSVKWLLASADLDNDGLPGWGIPDAWDFFRDKSINSANHPYTITTAVVMNSLLDALSLPSFWTSHERDAIFDLLNRTGLRFCETAYEETTINGKIVGYFWYSPSLEDSYFVPNVSSMFAGVLSRYLYEERQDIRHTNLTFLQRCVDNAVRGVITATTFIEQDLPFWYYSFDIPHHESLRKTPNDLIHHILTLYGIELYREFGANQTEIPWSRDQALESLEMFNTPEGFRQFPNFYTKIDPKPADLWGLGMALAFRAFYAGNDKSGLDVIHNIEGNYGDWKNLQVYPVWFSTDNTFYPRQAAFVLWGLSAYLFQ